MHCHLGWLVLILYVFQCWQYAYTFTQYKGCGGYGLWSKVCTQLTLALQKDNSITQTCTYLKWCEMHKPYYFKVKKILIEMDRLWTKFNQNINYETQLYVAVSAIQENVVNLINKVAIKGWIGTRIPIYISAHKIHRQQQQQQQQQTHLYILISSVVV